MRSLGDARPCAQRSAALKAEADKRMVASLRYLLSVIEEQGGFALDQGERLDAVERALAGGARLGAAAYGLHSQLREALEENDAGSALALARAFRPEQLCAADIVVSAQGGARGDALVQRLFDGVMHHEHTHEYKVAYDARPPLPEHYERSLEAYRNVLSIIEAHDPDTAEEIRAYVSDVLIIASEAINAGTSFKVHGLVLLRELDPARAWTTYLENIVHEAAHLHLFMVWTQDSVFASGADILGKSPLRRGERPLSGIFHALFVLARTIRAQKLFLAIPELADDVARMSTAYNNLRNPDPFEKKFAEARRALADADLTPVGRELMESCAEMVAA